MTASTRRVRYIGRNHDTPAYRATPIRETIAPMQPAYRRAARSLSDAIVMGAVVAAAVLLVSMIWRVALSWSAGL